MPSMFWRTGWPVVALLGVTIILIAPLWFVHVPAMPDYPAHLVSYWLIGGGYSPFYRIHWIATPNLAAEIVVPALAKLIGLEIAAKLFLSAGVAMWVLGAGAVQRALLGRLGIAPLFGGLFAYNANFFWGFFNYYFAAGLALVVFASWIASEAQEGPLRDFAFALAATTVYFCHVFAAASLLMIMIGFEIMRGLHARDLFRRLRRVTLIFLIPAFAFLLLRPAGIGDHGLLFDFHDTMPDRLESIFLEGFDAPTLIVPAIIGITLVLAMLFGRARLVKPLWLVLLFLLLAALAAPEEAMGGWGVHLRLPAFFAVLLLAATELKVPSRLAGHLAVLALLLAGWASISVAAGWTLYDQQTEAFRSIARQLPESARLLTVLDGDAIGEAADPPYWHMAEWTIMDRGMMTALMFTTKGQHVLALKFPFSQFAAATADQGMPPDIDDLEDLAAGRSPDDADPTTDFSYLVGLQCHYTQAVVINLGGRRSPVPPILKLRHSDNFFSIYDILPDSACRPSGQ